MLRLGKMEKQSRHTRESPHTCASARETVEAYLLGGDVTEAELEAALRHALACPECRASKPVSALLASSKATAARAAPARQAPEPVEADALLATWDDQGAEAALRQLDDVAGDRWSWLLEPEPAMGGGGGPWPFYRHPGGSVGPPQGTVERVADGTRLTVRDLPHDFEGAMLWLLVPSLRASGTAAADPPAGRFEATVPTAGGSATFALGDVPADAEALGPARIVAAAARG